MSEKADAQPDQHEPDQHHGLHLPAPIEGIKAEVDADLEGVKTPLIQGDMIANAIGGWRGMFDSSLPALVFLIVYLASGNNLKASIWSAIGAGVLIAVWRLIRRQSLQQIIGGFAMVALSAWLASRNDNASDFFLLPILINVAYGTGLAISALVGWPLIGVGIGAATGDMTGWRKDPPLRRAFLLATWVWVSMFALRVIVQVPLYFAQAVGAQGIAKIIMGWPLTLVAGFLTYRIVREPMKAAKARAADAAEADADNTEPKPASAD